LILQSITFVLHLLQPVARLAGRLDHGLTPWRRPRRWRFTLPAPRRRALWSESWRSHEDRLRRVEVALRANGERVRPGGPCDRWDLEVAGGALGAARVITTIEEHGRGRQLMRCRIRPRAPRLLAPAVVALAVTGAVALHQQAWFAGAALTALAVTLVTAAVCECGIATASALRAVPAAVADDRPGPRLATETGA
jgi:hypothetical protein